MCPRKRLENYKVVFRVNNIIYVYIGLIFKRHGFDGKEESQIYKYATITVY